MSKNARNDQAEPPLSEVFGHYARWRKRQEPTKAEVPAHPRLPLALDLRDPVLRPAAAVEELRPGLIAQRGALNAACVGLAIRIDQLLAFADVFRLGHHRAQACRRAHADTLVRLLRGTPQASRHCRTCPSVQTA